MNASQFYSELHARVGRIFEESSADEAWALQSKSHVLLADLETWMECIESRDTHVVLQKAIIEYQLGMYLVAIGQYRSAFAALRSVLELGLTAIEHSANIIHHREWAQGRRDATWASLVDVDNGVLSKAFCAAFFEGLKDEVPHMNALARTAYRACSEYVHGNLALDRKIGPPFTFSRESFTHWHDVAGSVRYVLFFVLAMRYLVEASSVARLRLETVLIDDFGHVGPIQAILRAPPET